MSLEVPTKEIVAFSAPVAKRSIAMPVAIALVTISLVAVLGGAGWYYFFGRKPKLAMSVALKVNADTAARGLWSAGPDELLLVADGDVQMIDLATSKKKWSAAIPKIAPVDAAWQAAMNARFVKLQQWSDELSRKRASLAGAEEIKAFNAEAAKYHSELTAARAEMANPKAPQPPAPIVKTPPPAAAAPAVAKPKPPVTPAPAAAGIAKPGYVFGGDRSAMDALRPVVDAGAQIIEARIKKRAAKLQAWRTAIDAKIANAKSPLQKSAAAEEELRYAAEMAEQRRDGDSVKKPGGKPAAPVAEAPAVPVAAAPASPVVSTVEEDAAGDAFSFDDDFGAGKPMAAICSDRIWIVQGRHAVAFDRTSGVVKAEVRLAGPVRHVISDAASVIVVAAAGSDSVQVVKLGRDAQPESSYFSTGRHEAAFAMGIGAVEPNVQKLRTEFSAIGGSLLRVEIRLKEKHVITRAAIKPGSEKELEAAAGNSAAHSAGELKSLTALIRNDATRLAGGGVEHVDDSTYEVTLRHPFESAAAGWTGALRGRVQIFSTPTLHLVTAGTKLLAFDRANKKIWEATLGSPVPIHRSGSETGSAAQPWLEAGGRLLFADGAFLSALDAKTGQVAWRLPSVGIRKMQMDGEGNLYVLSENLSVETLTYAGDASVRDSLPIVMRIDPGDGKILWKVEKYQDLWASGKDVYALREAKNPADMETQVFDPRKAVEARVKIYKLSRGSGSPLWDWFQPRHPLAAEVQGKNVALLFADELQIIRSICW